MPSAPPPTSPSTATSQAMISSRAARSALAQGGVAAMFVTFLAAWSAIGASVFGALAGAGALCIALPVLGWFIGLPIVAMAAMTAAGMWVTGYVVLFCGWGVCSLLGLALMHAGRRRR